MQETVTPERVLEMGQQWQKLLLEQMRAEEHLAGLPTEEVLAELPPERIEAWLQQRATPAPGQTAAVQPAKPQQNP